MSVRSKKILITLYPLLFWGYVFFFIIIEYGIFDSSRNILLRIAGMMVLVYGIVYLATLYRRVNSGYVPDKNKPNYTQMIIYGILGLASGWIPLLFLYLYGDFKGLNIFSISFYVL